MYYLFKQTLSGQRHSIVSIQSIQCFGNEEIPGQICKQRKYFVDIIFSQAEGSKLKSGVENIPSSRFSSAV